MSEAEEFLESKKIDPGYVLSRYGYDGAMGHKLTDLLDEYAQQVSKCKCDDCVHSFQKRGRKGYHDVEEYYKE